MWLKLTRLLHLRRVSESLIRCKNIVAEIFILHTYMFDNILSWVLAGFKLLLTIHFFACGWIGLFTYK